MKNEKGSVLLLITMVVLFSMSAFGWILFVMTESQLKSLTAEIDAYRALYLSEAGIAEAIVKITNSQAVAINKLGGSEEYSDGETGYYIVHIFKDIGNASILYQLTSIGMINDISREINFTLSVDI